MDIKRQGEVALALCRYHLRTSGITISSHKAREIGNISKTMNIPIDDLKEFLRVRIAELIEECLRKKPEASTADLDMQDHYPELAKAVHEKIPEEQG